MARWFLGAFALLAAGCTTFDLDDTWSRANTGAVQMSRDDWECRREVDTSAPRTGSLFVGGLVDAVRVHLDEKSRDATYAQCMEARGYTRTEKQSSLLR